MSTIVDEVAAVIRERYPDTGWLGDDLETVRDLLRAFLAVLESRGLKIVPVQATDGMCTALQWAESLDIDPGKWWTAALAFAPSVTLE